MTMATPDVKPSPPGSSPSSESSPEDFIAPDAEPAQKRKGGRKPVYATQEERKMRNRAAQAAFRERRTEYIKHLEGTIKYHEDALATLQQSSRSAAEEVLMLRYKNSLLERILLEKRIDVPAELKAFTQNDSPTAVPSLPLHPPHIQRALNQRRAFQHQFQAQMQKRQQQQQQQQQQRTSAGSSKRAKKSIDATLVNQTDQRPSLDQPSRLSPNEQDLTSPISPMQVDSFGLQEESPRPFLNSSLSNLSSFYGSNYQSHMDKLNQEYENDVDGYEFEEAEDIASSIPNTFSRPNYVLNHHHRSLSTGSGQAAYKHLTTAASTSAGSSGKAKDISMSAADDSNMQPFYNSSSWTVDLFSDPYLMGPLQFPNPFQTFPTSSMR